MRTTVTIDDDLLAEARVKAAREHRTIGSVLEEALRHFLRAPAPRRDEAYTLPRIPCSGGLRDGVDLLDKERLADLLGDNDLPAGT